MSGSMLFLKIDRYPSFTGINKYQHEYTCDHDQSSTFAYILLGEKMK